MPETFTDEERWIAEQLAEQAKRWAIVAVVTDRQEAIILNWGGFDTSLFPFDGVGSWAEDEGLEVPKLDKGVYHVSNIGIRADEDSFEAWGTWTLIAPLTPPLSPAEPTGGETQ